MSVIFAEDDIDDATSRVASLELITSDQTGLCITNCGKERKFVCAGCRVVRYCGKECQRTHWTRSHKETCKMMRLNTPVLPGALPPIMHHAFSKTPASSAVRDKLDARFREFWRATMRGNDGEYISLNNWLEQMDIASDADSVRNWVRRVDGDERARRIAWIEFHIKMTTPVFGAWNFTKENVSF